MTRRVPDARMVTLPYGHLIHAAAPREFAEAVTAFLTASAPAGR